MYVKNETIEKFILEAFLLYSEPCTCTLMQMNSAKPIVSNQTPFGFTLIELIVAISIVMILLIFAVAPYNFYADKSRVRLSVERVEQLMNKAKLLAGTGYAPQDKNVDLVVHIKSWSREITMSSIPANSSPLAIVSADRKIIEKIALESQVTISQIGDWSSVSGVDIIYRSPTGISQMWLVADDTSIPTSLVGTTLSGGILGVKWVITWPLSKSFWIIR